MRTLRVAMAQMNPTVGDVAGNVCRITTWIREAKKAKADLVLFPELAVTGSPPEDLLLNSQFVRDSQRALDEVIRVCRGVGAVVGYVESHNQLKHVAPSPSRTTAGWQGLYNAAALIVDRRLLGSYRKWGLSSDGVCDEPRYFSPGRSIPLLVINGMTIGVTIGGDLSLSKGPTSIHKATCTDLLVNIAASPFSVGQRLIMEKLLGDKARESGTVIAWANMVGGQDELVFDGNSLILDQSGEVIARGRAFEEELLVVDVTVEHAAPRHGRRGRKTSTQIKEASGVQRLVVNLPVAKRKRPSTVPCLAEPLAEREAVYQALVLAVRDYVGKNRFERVVIGLSGGVDSALTAAIAVDALGPTQVLGIFMPSPYTSSDSEEDVVELVRNLGIDLKVISITPTFEAYRQSLAPSFGGRTTDATEENLQARIRGNLLMAVSNKFGHLVLATGNKSELSVGYSTLYGDMAGGFAVIKDVPKTLVYELAQYRNGRGSMPVIPKRTLERPPTAELRFDQKDEDSLPPYAVLDPILRAYVEEDCSPEDIMKAGFDRTTVSRVIQMVDRSEFKRHQAPLGVKITRRAFGKDRRMPVTNRYSGT